MQQVGSNRYRFVETDDYYIDLEYTDNIVIVHLPYVKNFTKTVFLDFCDRLEGGARMFDTLGVDGVYAAVNDEKTERLVNMLGFSYLGDNMNYKVYKYASNCTRS